MTVDSPEHSQFYHRTFIETDNNPEEGEFYENLKQLAHYFDPKISDFNYLISLITEKHIENTDLLLSDQDFSIYQGLYTFPVSNPIKFADTGINNKILDFKEAILKRKRRFYNRIGFLNEFDICKPESFWIVSSKNISLRIETQKMVNIISRFPDLNILKTSKITKDDYNLHSLLQNLEKIKSNFKEQKDILTTSIYNIRACLSNTKNQLYSLLEDFRKSLNRQTRPYIVELFYNFCSLEEVVELASFKIRSGFPVDDLILNLFDNIPTDETELSFEELAKIALDFYNTNQTTPNALKNPS
jgi:hypothetical protein